jgi:hypothetical protein
MCLYERKNVRAEEFNAWDERVGPIYIMTLREFVADDSGKWLSAYPLIVMCGRKVVGRAQFIEIYFASTY